MDKKISNKLNEANHIIDGLTPYIEQRIQFVSSE